MEDKELTGTHLPEGAIQIPEGAAITSIRLPNMPSVYVNNAGFAIGGNDIRLFLGEQIPNTDGSGVTATQRLCLIMTPEFAKVLADNLVVAMTHFEEQFGKLRDITGKKQPEQKKPKT